jgi:hypothetical protein
MYIYSPGIKVEPIAALAMSPFRCQIGRSDSKSALHTEARSQQQLISRVPDEAIACVCGFTHQHPILTPLLSKTQKIYESMFIKHTMHMLHILERQSE